MHASNSDSRDRTPATESRAIKELGSRLAEVRAVRGMTISALAAAADVSAGFISQLERGKGNPSFLVARRLAQALDVPFGIFFSGDEHMSTSGVVRADARRRLVSADSDIGIELLSPSLHGKLGAFITRMPPHWSGEHAPSQHDGEEFTFILEGEAIVTVGGRPHRLGPGDSLTFDASEPHWGTNPGDVETVSLDCMTPPRI